ncbi:MAG: DsbE family thiol:disulfide interchange protein [Rhodospirillales bacterium]|nr:DsbE family thiol:disulfide interchange protein [Rhodospirillales bacterium]
MLQADSNAPIPADIKIGWRSRIFMLPILVFVFIGVAFAIGLTLDPSKIPSELIGKSAPKFDLPPVQGRALGLSDEALKGEVSLVNVFASWCVECRVEHPILMDIAKSNAVPIHGLNYKDKPDDAQNWLDRLGDPYTRTGADISGRVAIDWGVYGVPETFVIDKEGRVVHKHIGAINPKVWNGKIFPLIRNLQATE